ncbi:unnamed protein product [Trichobilharzia szidati]|nr:unnamed protein product [Trichobilharzia szidati]
MDHVHLCIFLTLIIGYLRDTITLGCNSRLLADRAMVPDTSFQHSSAATIQHGASAAREDPNDLSLQERAWCPDAKVGTELREFMEIDLGRQSIIKLIITKGRVAQSKGRQTTPYFYVKYRRELTSTWFDYEKENGTKRLAGNQDAMTENFNTMDPPFVARYVRIYPFSLEPTKTCLKLELLGCEASGIVEYKAPEGALLPETISPSHQIYRNNPSNERTRLLDTTYDLKSHKFRIFDSIHKDFSDEKTFQTIIEGGLGKLTDNDTEFKAITSPFSSHKFVGWRRKLTEKPLSTNTPSTESLADSVTSNYNTEMESDFVRIIFRFDMIYNFSSIWLYVSNDFLVGVTVPRNITVGFSFQDPSLYYYSYGNRNQKRSSQQKEHYQNPWSSSLVYQITPDKQNTDSRWITLPIHEILETNYAVQSVTKHMPSSVRQLSSDKNESKEINVFGLGEFVELRIFFNSQWLAVGEILFENSQMPNLKFKPEDTNPHEGIRSEPGGTTTGLPYLLNEHSSTLNFPLGQTTTYVLAIICSLLVILICCGLFCLFCVWGRERLRVPFRHKFNRKNKRFSDSTQFDSNPSVNKSSAQNTSLLADQSKNSNTLNNIVVTTTTTSNVSGDMQYQFQHPQRCQDVNMGLPSTTAYLGGFQLLTSNGVSPISINLTTNTIHQPFQQVGMENNYSTHPSLQNGIFSPSPNEVNANLLPTSIPGMNKYDPNNSISFVPIVTPSFIPGGSVSSNLQGTYLSTEENILKNINYGKTCHENSIYTSLPGSDCDSQPYAKVDTINGSVIRQYNSNNSSIDPSKMNISFNHCNGLSRLYNPLHLPPPPSLPLPPTPEHFTSGVQTMNLRHKNEFNHDFNSTRKSVNSAFYQYNSELNKSNPNDDIPAWLDSKSQLITTANPLFDTSLMLDQMNMNNINSIQTCSGIQNSDYSNSTTNESNTYSAYYGTPNMLPISVPTVQMISIKR